MSRNDSTPKMHLRLLGGKRVACGNNALYNNCSHRLEDISCTKCLNTHLYARLAAQQSAWQQLTKREDTLRELLFMEATYDTTR